jgi:hypothetical protein
MNKHHNVASINIIMNSNPMSMMPNDALLKAYIIFIMIYYDIIFDSVIISEHNSDTPTIDHNNTCIIYYTHMLHICIHDLILRLSFFISHMTITRLQMYICRPYLQYIS